MSLENCRSVEDVFAWLQEEDEGMPAPRFMCEYGQLAALRRVEALTLERAAAFVRDKADDIANQCRPHLGDPAALRIASDGIRALADQSADT